MLQGEGEPYRAADLVTSQSTQSIPKLKGEDFTNMFKKAEIEIYDLDLTEDIITASPGDYKDNDDDGDVIYPI